MKTITIVIPVWNEAPNIAPLYKALCLVATKLSGRFRFSYLFVDDGSTDESAAEIEKIVMHDHAFHVIGFSRNFGKEAATSAGIDYAQGDGVVLIDADLQHPPEMILDFVSAWEEGAEMVVGVRRSGAGDGIARSVLSRCFYWSMRFLTEGRPSVPGATDFRLLDRVVVEAYKRCTERNRYTRGLLDWLGFRVVYVEFDAPKRASGEGAYTFKKLMQLAVTAITTESLLPLRLAGYLGFAITLLAGILGLFVLIEDVIMSDPLGLEVSGTAMIVIMTLFLAGTTLTCLGLLSLYVANIHREVAGRPLYVVRQSNKTSRHAHE